MVRSFSSGSAELSFCAARLSVAVPARWLLLLLLLAVAPGPAWAQSGTITEAKFRAACLVNFFKFTDWPGEASGTTAPFVLGILGTDPLGDMAKQMTLKPVRNRPIVIKKCQRAEEAKDCHILYISSSEKNRLAEVLNPFKGSSVLTVGETETFTRSGGIINLTPGKKNLFEISKSGIERTKLRMQSQIKENGKEVP